MRVYIETLRNYWKLLVIPVVVAAAVGGWFTFGAAKTYRSSASVWVDDGPASGSWLDPTVAQQGDSEPPATVLQAELAQLLDSDSFELAIGDKSGLRTYLATTPRPKGFSPAVLLSHSSDTIAYQVERSLYKNVSSSVHGAQILSISYTGPTPAVSRSVLVALLRQLKRETKQLGVDFSIAETRYYARELTYRQQSATSLQDAAEAYLRLHPAATAATSTIYAALLSAAHSSSLKLANPTAAIALAARLESGGGTPLIRVIDAPSRPGAPVKGLGTELLGVLAGAFAGLVLSLLVTILLTPPSGTRWDQEEPGAVVGYSLAGQPHLFD